MSCRNLPAALTRTFAIGVWGLVGHGVASADDGNQLAASLGPVIELEVPDDQQGQAFLVDLDSATLIAPPSKLPSLPEFKSWLDREGVDAIGDGGNDGLWGVQMIARPIDSEIAFRFPNVPMPMTANFIEQMVSMGDPGTPIAISAKQGIGTNATYLFRTREGSTGVLQIAGWDPASQAVGIRYRLLTNVAAIDGGHRGDRSAHIGTGSGSERFDDFGPIVARTLHSLSTAEHGPPYMDLDTGKLLSRDGIKGRQFIEDRGVDLYPKPFPVHHTLKTVSMNVVGVDADVWADAQRVRRGLELMMAVPDRPISDANTDLPANRKEEPPATYLFKTHDGAFGILQLLDVQDDVRTLTLQYRLWIPREPAE